MTLTGVYVIEVPKDEEYFDTRERFINVMQRSRQTGQRSLHWKRNFSWDVVGEVEFRLKSFKEWSQIFRIFEIVVTSVRNMWRQRSPCTSGWPATLLMNSFKQDICVYFVNFVLANNMFEHYHDKFTRKGDKKKERSTKRYCPCIAQYLQASI